MSIFSQFLWPLYHDENRVLLDQQYEIYRAQKEFVEANTRKGPLWFWEELFGPYSRPLF